MLHRLLYTSRVAVPHLASAVEEILLASVINNRRDDLTGFLICDGVWFVQGLEGPRDLVEACFVRIMVDPRHKDVVVRDRGPAERRRFSRWSMCALYLSPKDDALLEPGDIGFAPDAVAPEALWQHLDGLGRRHGTELDAEHAALLQAAGIAGSGLNPRISIPFS